MKYYHDECCDYESDTIDYEEDYYDYHEIKFSQQLKYVGFFKIDIRKSPMFVGIDRISSGEILKLINSKKELESNKLELDELVLFDNIYYTLFGTNGTEKQYEYVAKCIMDKIYV